jgi:hypothetical protein
MLIIAGKSEKPVYITIEGGGKDLGCLPFVGRRLFPDRRHHKEGSWKRFSSDFHWAGWGKPCEVRVYHP